MWGGVERDAFDAPHVFDAPPWMLVRLCFMRHATTTHIFGASLHWFLHQTWSGFEKTLSLCIQRLHRSASLPRTQKRERYATNNHILLPVCTGRSGKESACTRLTFQSPTAQLGRPLALQTIVVH